MPPSHPDVVVFVSHAHDDWKLDVSPMVDRLKAKGVRLWTSHEDIKSEWGREIADILADPSLEVCVLLFLSPTSVQRPNVVNEIIAANNAERTIIPVLIEEFTLPNDIALHLARFHQIKGYDLSLIKLCGEIMARLPAEAEAASARQSSAPLLRLRISAAGVAVGDDSEPRPLRLSVLRRETIAYLIESLHRRGSSHERERVSRLLGMQLFSSVFPPEARQPLGASMAAGGRIELSFEDAHGIEQWPWELLHSWAEPAGQPSDFLVGRGRTITRVAQDESVIGDATEPPDAAVRLLTVVPKPAKLLPDFETLYRLVDPKTTSLATGRSALPAQLRALTEVTAGADAPSFTEQRVGWSDFTTAVDTFRPHVLHIAAAVSRDDDDHPRLAFADPTGVEQQAWARAELVADRLVSNRTSPRCVVAIVSLFDLDHDLSSSTAVRVGWDFAPWVPAVIVHRYDGGEETGRFLGNLYSRLLGRRFGDLSAADIEAILRECREDERSKSANKLYSFGEPVVFLNPQWVQAKTATSDARPELTPPAPTPAQPLAGASPQVGGI